MYVYTWTHISLTQKSLRATCETWPHKRKIFHLKSKRWKSCKTQSLPLSAAVSSILSSPFMLQPKACRSPSTNTQASQKCQPRGVCTRRILLKGHGLILRGCKRTCTLSSWIILLSHTWTTSIFSLTRWWRKPNEATQCLKKTAVLLWSWIILFQSHNVRFLRQQLIMLIAQIWELLINSCWSKTGLTLHTRSHMNGFSSALTEQ